MGVLNVISFFPPFAVDDYKNHPLRHGSTALPLLEVPKMSVEAICFTSSTSHGGCWVVLVPPLFLKKVFSHMLQTPQKTFTRLTPKINSFGQEKKT